MTVLAIIGYLARLLYAAGCWWSPDRAQLGRSGTVLFSGVVLDALLFRVGRDVLPFEVYLLGRALAQTYLALFVVVLLPKSHARGFLGQAALVPVWFVVVGIITGFEPAVFRSQYPQVRSITTTLVVLGAAVVSLRDLSERLKRGHISLLKRHTLTFCFAAADIAHLVLQIPEIGMVHYANSGVFDALIFVSCGLLAFLSLKTDRQVIREQYQRDFGADE